MLTNKTETFELCDNLVKQMQSWLNHFIQSVRLVDHLLPGVETLLACSVLSHVLINIITNDFDENVEDISVIFTCHRAM